MSAITSAMIVNGAVLAAVLEADVGPHRKIGWFRIARPLLTAAVFIPIYLKGFATHGNGLILEVAATIAGLLGGAAAMGLMRGLPQSPHRQGGQPGRIRLRRPVGRHHRRARRVLLRFRVLVRAPARPLDDQ